jgi:hypothetical protein
LVARGQEHPSERCNVRSYRDCQAAKEMVNKIELSISAHERAVAAQKELDAMPR